MSLSRYFQVLSPIQGTNAGSVTVILVQKMGKFHSIFVDSVLGQSDLGQIRVSLVLL